MNSSLLDVVLEYEWNRRVSGFASEIILLWGLAWNQVRQEVATLKPCWNL